jgi:pimeloyl-ACP methyl ester carboxylesterase
LRFDIEGLGDSDGDGGPYVENAGLYEPALAQQVTAAIADLTQAGVADRWVVAGLCAGASWAFHAVLADADRVDAAVLINPFAFDWEDELAAEIDVVRAGRLREAGTWGRVLSGHVSGERIRHVAAHAVKTPVEWRRRRRRMQTRTQREREQLDRLRDADKRLTFLIGRDEPIYDRFRIEGLLDELDRWPNVTLHRLPTRDHTFRAPWLQAKVHSELDAAIEAELARLPRMGAAPG